MGFINNGSDNFELLYCEISNGPNVKTAAVNSHSKNDRIKLLKFAKDGWDKVKSHFYTSRIDLEILKKLDHVLIHGYGKFYYFINCFIMKDLIH